MTNILLTMDLEDGHGDYAPDGRYIQMAEKFLDLCRETNRKATFFAIGKIATSAPNLIKKIAAEGHEIAYHSRAHQALTEEAPKQFKTETAEDKDRLEQLSGNPVIGFRAPRFSLTPKTVWALDILAENGFTYSSSIMPTFISLFGFSKAPNKPFRWHQGLVEFPLPVAGFIPYSGSIYLYAMPFFMTRLFAKLASEDEVLWTYTHPYDLDREETFKPLPETPLWVSLILYASRFRAEKQIRNILTLGDNPTFSEIMKDQDFQNSLTLYKNL